MPLWRCTVCLSAAFLVVLVLVFWEFCLFASLEFLLLLVCTFLGGPGACFLGVLPLCCFGVANSACLQLSWWSRYLFCGSSASVVLWSCKFCLSAAFLVGSVLVFSELCFCGPLDLQLLL